MNTPGQGRSSSGAVSGKSNVGKPNRGPTLQREPSSESMLKQLLSDCPLEARVAVHRVVYDCSLAGAKNALDRERHELLQRRERCDPGSTEYAEVQRCIHQLGLGGVQWSSDVTPMCLVEALAHRRLTDVFDVETARTSDVWYEIAVFVVLEQNDLGTYGIPEFMLPKGGEDSAGKSRRRIADRVKGEFGDRYVERAAACTKRLASRSPTQRMRDELAALDPMPRVYRGLDILRESSESDDPEIRNLLLSEVVPLVRDMSLHWPVGAMTSSAEHARDHAAGPLLAALGDCASGVKAEAIEPMRRMQSVLRSTLMNIVEMPTDVQIRLPRSGRPIATAPDAGERVWQTSQWINAAVRNELPDYPPSLSARLTAFARRSPQPSCVYRETPTSQYRFDVVALVTCREFSDLREVLMQAIRSGFAPPRLRRRKKSPKATASKSRRRSRKSC